MRRTLLALAPLIAVVTAAGCGLGTEPMPAAVRRDLSGSGQQLALTAAVDPVDVDDLRTGPRRPAIGVAYPFDVYSHCGIVFARFGGHTWRAERPTPEPRPKPDELGTTSYSNYTAGTMTLVDRGTAWFVIDVRRAEPVGSPVVVFRPTHARPRTCR